MTEKELVASRNKVENVTNILEKDFDFKWDGIDYTIEKGETKPFAFYLAEHCAFHMSRKYCLNKNIDFTQEGGKVVDKIMGKEFIEYNKLTKKEATEIAEKRKISLENEKGEIKTLKVLLDDLKASH